MNYQRSEFQASYGISSQLPAPDRPEFAFSGRSNVGKSSLITNLCNRKNLARVSSTPGKTATINFYRVDTAYFVDLPGYGFARVSDADRARWDELINGYFEAGPSADDRQMLDYLHYHGIPFVVALTKADKLKKAQQQAAEARFRELCAPYGCRQVFLTSAEKGTGIDALRACLDAAVGETADGL